MKSESPLLWQWHDKIYFGAAHGMAGILYMLLQVMECDLHCYVVSHSLLGKDLPHLQMITVLHNSGPVILKGVQPVSLSIDLPACGSLDGT